MLNVKNQTTNNVYTLDDGSGRFEARHWAEQGQGVEDVGEMVRYVFLFDFEMWMRSG